MERIDSGRPISHVAAEAGVSRQRLGVWYRRWRAHGEQGLGWAFVEIDGVYQAGVCLRTSDEGARGDTFMVKGDGSSAAPDVPNDAMPLGAVVAIATLADCLPMANHMDLGDTERIVVGYDTLDHCIPADEDQSAAHGSGFAPEGAFLIRDITDQLPYGHFAVGRWGWMLTDIDQLDEPIRATGKQGVWEWTP